MSKKLIRRLTGSGVKIGDLPSAKRSILFSNYISLILSVAGFLLFIIVPQNRNLGGFIEAIFTAAVFSIPILLNQLSLTVVSKIYLSWIPPLLITWAMILGMKGMNSVPSSSYAGLRIYLLASSCIPYLLLDRKNVLLFMACVLPSLLLVLFCDYFLNLFGVGYSIKGVEDLRYEFLQARSVIAYVIIGGSCFALRLVVDKNDQLNQQLIAELEQKNQIIQEQAKNNVQKLNIELQENLQKLQAVYERLDYHVNNTPLAVIERDKDRNITFWNKRAEELFGWQQHEILGKKAHEFLVTQDDKVAAERLLKEMVDGDFNANSREIQNVSKDGKILFCNWYYSLLRNEDGGVQGVLSFVSDVTSQKEINHQLKERIKELTTLYRAGQILQNKDRPVDEVLQELAGILPPGWQYPEITAARIVIGGIEFKTSNFISDAVSKQRAEFILPQGFKGIIEVAYLKETPEESEGAFLKEERDLINMIAELLRTYFVRRFESEALRKSEANLNATINNTNVLIWSVDRNLNLLAFNKPFFDHMKKYYGLELKVGYRILNGAEGELPDHKWEGLYKRSLEGETVTFEENAFGIDYYHSLSPIIGIDGLISGVSVFAEDITEDKVRGRELGEALKKIGELRLMALRSVMNPHFIFNVLNSIQFYIVANDRLNAVNYLSMFSKLIRNILTHSVNNKIKLEDEIEMLKNYVQLEMVRFENKFTFDLEVDPNLEIDSIEIPSLLIQPYVENAILHGLYNKQGKGTLLIRIREDQDSVVFEIEDDGVGREAAMKIRQRSFADHKSLGVKLTEERLKLINEHHNVSSQIIDLKNGNEPSGTKIIIWVKLSGQSS